MINEETQKIIDVVKDKKTAAEELVAQGLSPEKVAAMQKYAFLLHRAFPKMNANKVKQRVAKKFNLKIV